MTCLTHVIAYRPVLARFAPEAAPIRRPRLLVAAARLGQSGWRRQRDLRRLLRLEVLPEPEAALTLLNAEEARLDRARRENAAEYDLQRHVLVLIGILAERAALAALSAPETASRAHP